MRFMRAIQVLLATVTVLVMVLMSTPELTMAEDLGAVVDLALLPSSQTVERDIIFEIAITAQCNGQDITGIAASVDFDPNYLEVQSITDGGTLTDFVVSDYDNVAGTIDYNAGTFTQPLPSGTFTVAIITFKAINPDGSISINFSTAFPRESDADFGGDSKLGELHGTTITIIEHSTPDSENTPPELPPDNPEEPDTDSNSLPGEEENTSSEPTPDNHEDPGTDSNSLPEEEENTSSLPPSSQPNSPPDPQPQENLPTDNDGIDWYIPASIIIGLVAIGILVIRLRRERSS